MKTLRKTFTIGIPSLLCIGVILLTWLGPSYSGEWEPVLPALSGKTIEIKIKNMQFANAAGSVSNHILIIPVGIGVKWVNVDPLVTVNGELGLMPHGIKIADPTEKVITASPILTYEHDTFSYTFSKEGHYSYACFIHPFMTGKIVVVNLPGINQAVNPDGEQR